MPPAAKAIAAGAGVGLVGIGVKVLLNKVAQPSTAGAQPRMSDTARAATQIGVGLVGGALIDQFLSMPRVGAAFAAANTALGSEPFVAKWLQPAAPVATAPAAPAVNPPAALPGAAPSTGIYGAQTGIGMVQPRRR